eukprot:gb/GFBE01056043.1/.p1 GENE.gb/GFBE01056043.1/~~gb/GFBE01056043.1/.p1  ORF type:complete len:797 (+),score=88.35 gb/GFBE01056043.1/:1-2391(+)
MNTTEQVLLVPRPLWCSIALYNGVDESLSARRCCRSLLKSFEEQMLWRQHALDQRFVVPRPEVDADVATSMPQAHSLLRHMDWFAIVRLNARQCQPSVLIRVRNFGIRMPLRSRGELCHLRQYEALMASLSKIFRAFLDPNSSWRPLRLRWLQWGGRPGKLAEAGALVPGSQLLLEWALAGSRSWPLPPQDPSPGNSLRELQQQWTEQCRFAWPPATRQLGELQDWHCHGQDARFMKSSETGDKALLVRIASSILRRNRWIEISADCSVMSFLEKITEVFRQEFPVLVARSVHFRLVDMRPPQTRKPEDGHPTLRSLAWAQSETVYVEVRQEGCGVDATDIIFDLKREPAFSDLNSRSAAGEERTGNGLADLRLLGGFDRSASSWSRSPPLDAAPDMPAVAPGTVDPSPAQESDEGSGRTAEGRNPDALHERVVPHYPPVILPGTQMCRQFEFHPLLPDILLTGDKKGAVRVVSASSPQETALHPPLEVDKLPLLGLSWMRHNPHVAVCGASNSGAISFLRYNPDARMGTQNLEATHCVERFPKLSSLSINCSDNFLLASGISTCVAVYDVETGKAMSKGSGVHEHFINISRFCNSSPHIFATASFDCTCKIWDLRIPLKADKAVKVLDTRGHNVMCVFSPDDRHFLCCGVDTRLVQFEVPSWRQTPCQLPLRPPVHQERYRRAAYLATGRHLVTGSTEESHIHLMSVQGKKHGVVDLRNVTQESVVQTWQQELIGGKVAMDDADPMSGSSRKNHEFVQSLRAHPVLENRIAVLMAKPKGTESNIVLVDLDSREVC